MTAPLLLDTCAALWMSGNEYMKVAAVAALDAAVRAGETFYLSPITAWEVGILAARNRITLPSRPETWFRKVTATQGITLAGLPGEVLIAASFLPGTPPNDPMDRIIIATAREYGYRIVTRDRLILAYAESGLVMALPC